MDAGKRVWPMKKPLAAAVLALALLLSACGAAAPQETVDPYAGMVQVESGYNLKIWVEEQENVPVSDLSPEDFSAPGRYIGTDYGVTRGMDVSEHQGQIDWTAAADDVDFAIIRVGYRGYGQEGVLKYDERAQDNLRGALDSGLDVGVYFFSQATSPAEAEEEAAFLLALLEPYGPERFALPVFFDWENIDGQSARTEGMEGGTVTDCALAFCQKVTEAGYRAGIYAYRFLGYYCYELARLGDYALWIGAVGDYPDFYYAHEIWQYSTVGSIHGVGAVVDLDLRFVKKQQEITFHAALDQALEQAMEQNG